MVYRQLVIEIHNLLDGTWNITSRLLNGNESAPAADSPAMQEIATAETGPGGPWGREPALTAFSYATMASFAAGDHLGCLATLISSEGVGGIFGPLVLARACIEASARMWWMLDDGIDIRERVGRSFRLRVRNIDESLHLLRELLEPIVRRLDDPDVRDSARREHLTAEIANQEARRVEVLEQAMARGVPLHYQEKLPVGINVAMPKHDELVGSLLAAADFSFGAATYALLSGVAHAMPVALQHYFRQADADDPDLLHLVPELTNETLLMMMFMVLSAYTTAFDRLVVVYGWDRSAWDSWTRHVTRKFAELLRRLDATDGVE